MAWSSQKIKKIEECPSRLEENFSEVLSPSELDDDSYKLPYLERRSRYVLFPW